MDWLKFKKNVSAKITFTATKGNDWWADKQTHEEYGDSFRYKAKWEGNEDADFAGGDGAVSLHPDAQKLMVRAQIKKGDTVTITKKEDPKDSKKNVWTLKTSEGVVFSSRDGDDTPQDAQPPAKSATEPPKSAPPDQEPPHSADVQPPASNGHAKNGTFTFLEVVCMAWKSYQAARSIAPGSPEDARSLAGIIAIRAEKERIHPTDQDLERFKAAMKEAAPKPPGAPATGHGRVAGSNPTSPDVWFDLCQKATNANIPDEDFEEIARKIVAAHLKVANLPPGYDMKKMPKDCVEEIERDIAEYSADREAEARV